MAEMVTPSSSRMEFAGPVFPLFRRESLPERGKACGKQNLRFVTRRYTFVLEKENLAEFFITS